MSDVLRRKMFAVSVEPKADAMNVGIMSGFSEPEESEYEGPEMEEGGDEEDQYADRRPDNLEIIANNLRGDYKSLDNRYVELAMKVGEEAAAQTPPEVIALMQPQMAQQMQAGIAGLPQAQQVMPGATGAPPMPAAMPPGPPPTAQGPMPQMAKGGFIQKYSLGTLAQGARFMLNAGRTGLGAVTNYGMPLTLGATGAGVTATTLSALDKNIPKTGVPIPDVNQIVTGSPAWAQRTGLMNPMPTVAAPSNIPIYAEGPPADPEAALMMGSASDALRVPVTSPAAQTAQAAQTVPTPTPPGQGLIVPGVTPDRGPQLPTITEVIGAADPSAGDTTATAAEVVAALPTAKASPAAVESDLKKRALERAGVYKEIVGDDKEAAQAQALFALADFGLRLAGARGRSLGERVSKAGENLPATLMKIGEKVSDTDKAIKLAALKAAEEDMALEKKLASAQSIAAYKKSSDPKLQHLAAVAQSLAGVPALSQLDEGSILNIARLYIGNKDTIQTDEATGQVSLNLPGRAPVLLQGGQGPSETVSFIKPDDPVILSKERFTKVVSPEERKKIAAKLASTEAVFSDLNKAINTFNKDAFGVVGGIKSTYNFVAPLIPFAEGSSEQARAETAAAVLAQRIKSTFSSDTGRQLKAEYQDVDKLVTLKPGNFFKDYKTNMESTNELRKSMLERMSQLRAQLTGGEAYVLKSMPTGLGTDSPLTPAFESEITRIGSVNPNMLIYFQASPNQASVQIPVSQAMRIMEMAKSKATENRAQGIRF